jgi:hypothetical protein
MVHLLQQRGLIVSKILRMVAGAVGAERDVHALAQHLDDRRHTVAEHHVAHRVVRHRGAGLF